MKAQTIPIVAIAGKSLFCAILTTSIPENGAFSHVREQFTRQLEWSMDLPYYYKTQLRDHQNVIGVSQETLASTELLVAERFIAVLRDKTYFVRG